MNERKDRLREGTSLLPSLDTGVLFLIGAWLFLAVVFSLMLLTLVRGERARASLSAQLAWLADLSERLACQQGQIQGRLEQSQTGVHSRLDRLAERLGDGLMEQGRRTSETLSALHERLAVIDQAQTTIALLSSQVVNLQDILANKQARGAFGEVQLQDLIRAALPPSVYAFQVTLRTGTRADCLLRLPDPPGAIVVDAKFPLESYRVLKASTDEITRARAAREFATDVLRHIRAIEERYLVPGETADQALMFLPSEAIYAELHANFRNVVEDSFRRKVWIVSPTTLMATLNTIRAVLRDVHVREEASRIQSELRAIAEEATRLDQRTKRLERHFDEAVEDVRSLRATARKISVRASQVDMSRLNEGAPPPAPTADATLNTDLAANSNDLVQPADGERRS